MTDIIGKICRQLSSSNAIIRDEFDSLRYNDVVNLIGRNEDDRHSFDAIAISNVLQDAVQIIGHFVNKQNFLVLNGNLTTNHTIENVPQFCERLIYFNASGKVNLDRRSYLNSETESLPFAQQRSWLDSKKSYLVLKTSGTTNQPKYVLHDQELVLLNSQSVACRLGLNSEDRVLIPVPIHHSYGLVTAFIPSLIAGCSIRLLRNTNFITLIEALKSFRPTVLFATPTLIEMLIKIKGVPKIPKVTITAGDRIREESFLIYEDQIGTLLNLYGSTEMGAMAVSNIAQEARHRAKAGLVALPDIEFKVFGDDERGDIYCRNASRFSFYINHQGEHIESKESIEWFNTKDLGTVDGDEIKVLGRSDYRINRNGILMSYFEIENAVECACRELNKVVVVKLPTQDMLGNQFAIVCEVKEDSNIDENQIRLKCLQSLPRTMVPDTIEIVEALPRLPNGKIDRSFLQTRFQ